MSAKRWVLYLVGLVTLGLLLCGTAIYCIYPFFHYHNPDPEAEVWPLWRAVEFKRRYYEIPQSGFPLSEAIKVRPRLWKAG